MCVHGRVEIYIDFSFFSCHLLFSYLKYRFSLLVWIKRGNGNWFACGAYSNIVFKFLPNIWYLYCFFHQFCGLWKGFRPSLSFMVCPTLDIVSLQRQAQNNLYGGKRKAIILQQHIEIAGAKGHSLYQRDQSCCFKKKKITHAK